MQKNIVRHATIGSIALLGLIVIAASAWLLFPFRMTVAEDLLPSQRVAVFVRLQAEADREKLMPWLPLLKDLPVLPAGSAAALLKLDDGSLSWVVLTPPAHPRGMPVAQAGDRRALALFQTKPASPLRTAALYARLAALGSATAARVFVQPQILGSTLVWMSVDHPFLIETEDRITRVIAVSSLPAVDPLPPTLALAFMKPRFVLAGADAPALWRALSAPLALREVQGLEGRLTAWLQGVFGADLSPTYDLGPLLAGRVTLQGATGSGQMLLLLEGTIRDRAQTEERLGRLHQLFARAAPTGRVEKRVFEGGFGETAIALDPEETQTTTRSVNGWVIRETQQKHNALITAIGGSRFLLSNSPERVEAVLREQHGRLALSTRTAVPGGPVRTHPDGPAREGGVLIAGGFLDPAFLTAEWASFLPPSLPFLSCPSAWSAVQYGERVVFAFTCPSR